VSCGTYTKIKEAGVKSLKIEGRLKRTEYVALVTWIYKKLIRTGQPPSQNDLKRLEIIF
jgi:putative protease